MIKTNIARHLMLSTATLAAAGAAAGAVKTATTPATAAKPKREPIKMTDIVSNIPIPENVKGARGSKSQYKFADLTEVGMSFGVIGRTAHQMSSVISNQNKKLSTTQDTNPDGSLKYDILRDGNGAPVGPDTNKPIFKKGPQYVCADVSNEKGGVTARVWRTA